MSAATLNTARSFYEEEVGRRGIGNIADGPIVCRVCDRDTHCKLPRISGFRRRLFQSSQLRHGSLQCDFGLQLQLLTVDKGVLYEEIIGFGLVDVRFNAYRVRLCSNSKLS